MLKFPQTQKFKTGFFIFLAGILIINFISFTGKAQTVDEIDTIFENARGQLLGIYNSEVISHAGIILGLIIALGSTASDIWKGLNSKRKKLRFLAVFAFLLIVLLLIYSVGRLFYWSSCSGALMGVTRSNIGVTINSSNATSCLFALANYTTEMATSDVSITTVLASLLHPNNLIFLAPTAVTILVVIPALVVYYTTRTQKKGINQNKDVENGFEKNGNNLINNKKSDKKALIAEYETLNRSVNKRSSEMLVVDSFLLPSSVAVVTFAIIYRQSLGLIAGFFSLISLALVVISYFFWVTANKINGVVFSRLHEIEIELKIKGHHYIRNKIGYDKTWWKIRRNLWHGIFWLFIVAYGFIAIWLFGVWN